MDCPRALDRRQLLLLAGASTGLVVLGGSVSGCSPHGDPPTGPESAGNISQLQVGTLLIMSNVVVALDANGVYGMSAVCTHAGCLLDDGAQTIAAGLGCPCHGSHFDGNGAVTRGPADTPLQHYAVTIAADGSLTVDGSQPVPSSTRTPTG
ncbi:MAG TPA: Rieske (2Fe-2S) protein [Polyangia bacterium]|nr:Rieske (2Fe-2S) protein [Polyangia bacterium]